MYSQGLENRGGGRTRQEKPEYGSVSRGQRYDDDEPPVSKVPYPPSTVYFFVGLFVLGMLCMVPVWNAVSLKYDQAFEIFLGITFPNLILLACFGVLFLYGFTICCYNSWQSRMQSDATMLTIGTCFLTLLGVLLLVISSPLRTLIYATATDIWSNCQFGGATHEYYDTAVTLNALRATPECKDLPSVEQCQGYVSSPAAIKLKEMETSWHCSGFCYTSPGSEMQGEMAALGGISLPFCRDSPPPCKTSPFPPTLFSNRNDEVSCDGIAARDISSFGKEVADQSFYEGICLVLVALIIAIVRVLGFCSGQVKFSGANMRIRGRAPPPVPPPQTPVPQPPQAPVYVQYSEPVPAPQPPPVQYAQPPPAPVQYAQPPPTSVQYVQYIEPAPVQPPPVQYVQVPQPPPSPVQPEQQFTSQYMEVQQQPQYVEVQQQPQYVEVRQQPQYIDVQQPPQYGDVQQQPQYADVQQQAQYQQQQQQQPQYGSMPSIPRIDPVFTP